MAFKPMKPVNMIDETELRRNIVVYGRGYSIPKDVADYINGLETALLDIKARSKQGQLYNDVAVATLKGVELVANNALRSGN